MKTIISALLFSFHLCILVQGDAKNICIPVQLVDVKDANHFLQEIKNDITAKLSENKDTAFYPHVDMHFDHPAIRINGTLDNVTLSNLLDYNLCILDYNEQENQFVLFNFTFYNLRAEGIYNITGDLGDLFDIYGIGPYWLEQKNMSFSLSISLNQDEVCFNLPLDINFNILEITNHFENFMKDEELEALFNKAIHQLGPEIVSIIWLDIKDKFKNPTENIISSVLTNHKFPKNLEDFASFLPFCFSSHK